MVEEWLLDAIKQKTGMSSEVLDSRIKAKLSEFPNLTEDAAAKMLATENGITPIRRNYKIKDISTDIKHITLSAQIKKVFPPREIKIKGTASKIMNLVLSDDTGNINVVIWDAEKINQIHELAHDGDQMIIVNGYSKENKINGSYEINISKNSAIKITPAQTQRVQQTVKKYSRIGEISAKGSYTVNCFLARVFTNGNLFIVKCRLCNKKVADKCEIHGDKAISKTLMVSGVLDDGIASIRASFFDKAAEKLLALSDKSDINQKLNDLSFGMEQIEVDAISNEFNGNVSLNVKDVRKAQYDLT